MNRIGLLVLTFCVCFLSAGWAQQPARTSRADWTEFHRHNMMRWNPYEHVLNVKNVGGLTLKWSYLTGGFVRSSPAVALRTVYFGSCDGHLYGLNASSGQRMWHVLRKRHIYSSPVVAEKLFRQRALVLVGSDDGNLIARRAHGLWDVWIYPTGGPVNCSPTVVDGVVYIASGDGNVYALDANGQKLWSYATGNWVSSSPAVANATVYIGSDDGYVYAFGLKK